MTEPRVQIPDQSACLMVWFLLSRNGGLNTWDFEGIRFIALGFYFFQKCKASAPAKSPFTVTSSLIFLESCREFLACEWKCFSHEWNHLASHVGPLCCLHSVPLSPCPYCPPGLHAGLLHPTGCYLCWAPLSFSEAPSQGSADGDTRG